MENQDELTREINLNKVEQKPVDEIIVPANTEEQPKKPEKHIMAGAIGGSSLLLFMLPQFSKNGNQAIGKENVLISTKLPVDTKIHNGTFEEALYEAKEDNKSFFIHKGELHPTITEKEWNILEPSEKVEYLDQFDVCINPNPEAPFNMDYLSPDGKPMRFVWNNLHEELKVSLFEDKGGNLFLKDSQGNTSALENVTKNSDGEIIRVDPITGETEHFSPNLILDQANNKGFAVIGEKTFDFNLEPSSETITNKPFIPIIQSKTDNNLIIPPNQIENSKPKLEAELNSDLNQKINTEKEEVFDPIVIEPIADKSTKLVSEPVIDAINTNQKIDANLNLNADEVINEEISNINSGDGDFNFTEEGIQDLLNN